MSKSILPNLGKIFKFLEKDKVEAFMNQENRIHKKRVILDKEIIRSLYEDKELSQHQIAQHFKISPTTVCKFMRKHDIKARPVGREPNPLIGDIDLEDVKQTLKNSSIKATAHKYNTTYINMYNFMKRNGIIPVYKRPLADLTPEKALELKLAGVSLAEMAERFNVSRRSMSNFFRKHHIPTLPGAIRIHLSQADIEKIKILASQRLSVRAIGQLTGHSSYKVRRVIIELNLKAKY